MLFIKLNMHHICIISGVPDIATPKSYLEDENIFGGEEEVAAGLLEWTPTPAQFSNGLVLELYEKFGTKKGTRLMGAVVQKIAKYPTLQAYTKIADISQFMVELMAEVK